MIAIAAVRCVSRQVPKTPYRPVVGSTPERKKEATHG